MQFCSQRNTLSLFHFLLYDFSLSNAQLPKGNTFMYNRVIYFINSVSVLVHASTLQTLQVSETTTTDVGHSSTTGSNSPTHLHHGTHKECPHLNRYIAGPASPLDVFVANITSYSRTMPNKNAPERRDSQYHLRRVRQHGQHRREVAIIVVSIYTWTVTATVLFVYTRENRGAQILGILSTRDIDPHTCSR